MRWNDDLSTPQAAGYVAAVDLEKAPVIRIDLSDSWHGTAFVVSCGLPTAGRPEPSPNKLVGQVHILSPKPLWQKRHTPDQAPPIR